MSNFSPGYSNQTKSNKGRAIGLGTGLVGEQSCYLVAIGKGGFQIPSTYPFESRISESVPIGPAPRFYFAWIERLNILLEVVAVPALVHPSVGHVEGTQAVIVNIQWPVAWLHK